MVVHPFQSVKHITRIPPKVPYPTLSTSNPSHCNDQAILSLLVLISPIDHAAEKSQQRKTSNTAHIPATTPHNNPHLIPGKSQTQTPAAKTLLPWSPIPHNLHLPHFRQVLLLLLPLSSSSVPSHINSFGPPSHTLHMSLPPPPLPTPSSPLIPCPCPLAPAMPSSRTDSSTQQKLVKSCTHLRYCSSRNSIVSGFGQLLNVASEVGSRSMAS